MTLLHEIKTTHPLVLNIANTVTQQRVADGLSIVGASPLMTEAMPEINELVSISQAVVLNIGTITDEQLELMIQAGSKANELQIPVVLDPVAVNMPYRSQCVKRLAETVHFDFIRGNASEIAWFAKAPAKAKGIDALEIQIDVKNAEKAAQLTGAIILQSGAIDVISDGQKTATLDYNNINLAINVGAGDLLSALVGAFTAVSKEGIDAVLYAAMCMNIAGQKATWQVGNAKPGTYMATFFDELYALNDEAIQAGEVTWR